MKAVKAIEQISEPAREHARLLYDSGTQNLNEIAATLGLTRRVFQIARQTWAWPKRRPAKFRNVETGIKILGLPFALADKIEAQLRRELDAVEAMLSHDPSAMQPAAVAEKRARTIASLVRALVELRRLDLTHLPPEEAEEDDFPDSLEELRAELARRIDRLRQNGRSESPDGQT